MPPGEYERRRPAVGAAGAGTSELRQVVVDGVFGVGGRVGFLVRIERRGRLDGADLDVAGRQRFGRRRRLALLLFAALGRRIVGGIGGDHAFGGVVRADALVADRLDRRI